MKIIENIAKKRSWSKRIKELDPFSNSSILKCLKFSLEDLLYSALDYLFMPDIETMSYEIAETISDINIMLDTDDQEEYTLSKKRLLYMLDNKLENWYL